MDPFCDVRSAGPISYLFTFEHAADAAAARERCCSTGSHRHSSWYHIRGLASRGPVISLTPSRSRAAPGRPGATVTEVLRFLGAASRTVTRGSTLRLLGFSGEAGSPAAPPAPGRQLDFNLVSRRKFTGSTSVDPLLAATFQQHLDSGSSKAELLRSAPHSEQRALAMSPSRSELT
jgi:hypothetical protein